MSCTLSWQALLIVLAIGPLFADWGGFHISQKIFEQIEERVPHGGTILELGSGWGTGELAKYYHVYSIEHDPQYVGLYDSHYIYAPIVHSWYDIEVLKKELPSHYDLILIDGPPCTYGRGGFLRHLDLFHTDVPMIFDDVHRVKDLRLAKQVASKLQKKMTIIYEEDPQSITGNKGFAIVE